MLYAQAGAGIVHDSVPESEWTRDARTRRARCFRAADMVQLGLDADGNEAMLLLIDNYDSFTYNLVQYLGELGADVHVASQRRDRASSRSPRGSRAQIVISPGPCTPNEAGISVPLIRALRRQDSDPRRVPRPSGDRPGVRRDDRPRRGA